MEHQFTIHDTRAAKGLAILMMLMHHLWSIPDRIYGGELTYFFTVFDQSLTSYLGDFGQMCVSIFFFLSGFGLYRQAQKKPIDYIGKIKSIYISYWKVFFIVVPLGFLFFSNQPIYCVESTICTKFSQFTVREFLMNVSLVETSYTMEWWFLRPYLCALITFPLVRSVIRSRTLAQGFALVCIGSVFVTNIFPSLGQLEVLGGLGQNPLYNFLLFPNVSSISSFWCGCLMANNGNFERIEHSLAEHRILTFLPSVLILALLVFFRNTGIGTSLDIIYVPIFLMTSKYLLDRLPLIRTMFLLIGKQSTNIWLTHTLYCYYFYPLVVFITKPRYAVPTLLLLLIVSYLGAVVLTQFWKGIRWITWKLHNQLRRTHLHQSISS